MGLLGLMGNVGSYLIPKLAQNTPASGGYNTSIQGTPTGGGSNTVVLGKVTDQSDYTQNTTPGGTTVGSGSYQEQAPAYNTSIPDVPMMSWETAMRRAEEMYKPKYEAGVLARDKMASDQREMLAQTMAARGYAHPAGGKWESGTGNITQEQAMDQQSLANDFEASKAQYANALINKDWDNANAMMNALINQQNQQNVLKQADWATKQTAATNKENNDTDEYNNTMSWLLKLLGLE